MIVDMGLNSPLGLSDTWTEWCDVEITKDGSDRPVSIVATGNLECNTVGELVSLVNTMPDIKGA